MRRPRFTIAGLMTLVLLVALGFAALRRHSKVIVIKNVHQALELGAVDRALALLKRNPALVHSLDGMQQTPLHVASHRGRVEAAKWLIAHGAVVNAKAYSGFTPLHLTKDAEIAQALIMAGADLDGLDNWGNTPLQNAAETENQAVVEAILASGYKIDLRTALMLRNRNLVKRMIRDDPSIAKKPTKGPGLGGSKTPLGLAAGQGDREVVELLLDAGADINEVTDMPNAGGYATALTSAVWAGDEAIVELLLEHGAKTAGIGGKWYSSILDYAREHSSPEIVALLEKAQRGTN